MKNNEFSQPGEEFAPPRQEFSTLAQEFSSPGQENFLPGSEFHQTIRQTAQKKKRRVNPMMLTAAAVISAAIVLGGHTSFPQPENFSAAYREYLDEIMEACVEGDDMALHQLATSSMADEFWDRCLEPYKEDLHSRGFSTMVYYDGTEMTLAPQDGPALYFLHSESTQEELIQQDCLQFYTEFTYYQNASQLSEGTQGAHYSGSYGSSSSGNSTAPYFITFHGELSLQQETAYYHLYYQQGTFRQYNGTGLLGDTPDVVRLENTLTGTFSHNSGDPETELSLCYLEDGTWTMHFPSGDIDTTVSDGSIILHAFIELVPSETPGLYNGFTIYAPDRSSGTGWGSPHPLTQEDLLYHPPYLTAH